MAASAEQAVAAPSPPLLAATNVTLELGGEKILDAVSLSVAAGESVTLVGPNGAGKTMLLRVLLGLVAPTSGTVTRRPGLRVGYLPQVIAPDPILPMDILRFVGVGNRARVDRRLRGLEEVGIGHLAGRPVHELSGGELRRAMLARALLREPEILVLDEPVQGVDVGGQLDLYRRITRVGAARRYAVLMVSHELCLVMAATDRVVCLNRHVCCEGAPESVQGHPEYRAMFGAGAEGLAVYTHSHDHVHGPSGQVVPPEAGEDGPRIPDGSGG